jgi:hypothetical protein
MKSKVLGMNLQFLHCLTLWTPPVRCLLPLQPLPWTLLGRLGCLLPSSGLLTSYAPFYFRHGSRVTFSVKPFLLSLSSPYPRWSSPLPSCGMLIVVCLRAKGLGDRCPQSTFWHHYLCSDSYWTSLGLWRLECLVHRVLRIKWNVHVTILISP